MPLAYFLTWTTYGTWLPGDGRGWVDRRFPHGEVVQLPRPRQESHAWKQLRGRPVILNEARRALVDGAVRRVCVESRWHVHALEVRTNHVHVVVTAADSSPGKVMGVLKAHGTKALRAAGAEGEVERWWTRDGSKRILHSQQALEAAIRYVLNQDLRGDGD